MRGSCEHTTGTLVVPANAGTHTPSPELRRTPLSGIVEAIDGGTHPQALLRVDAPVPGALFAGACPMGQKVFLSVSFYLYGDTAAAAAAREEPAWAAWMTNLFPA